MADASVALLWNCKQCSSWFSAFEPKRGRKPSVCPPCKANNSKASIKRWQETNKGYHIERARRFGVRPRDQYVADVSKQVEKECVVCGGTFKRRSTGRDAGKCCSRECGFEWIRQHGTEPKGPSQLRLDILMYGRWAKRYRAAIKFKVRREERDLRQARIGLLGAIILFVRNPQLPCTDCAKPIGSKHMKQRLCSECRRARAKEHAKLSRLTPASKAHKRIYKARRRAVERGAEAERFDPLEILMRDGWRCHMCGIKTPQRLRGTYDDRAPELDHIAPLSQGGTHTRINTACACRRCNIAKSNKPLGQLRLVA